MAKYRLLSQAELQEMEKEFIQYLIVNGITAEDWEQMKSKESSKAEEIVDLFSDVVFEGVMRKVKFLDYKSENSLKTFQCLEDKIVLVAIEVEGVNLLDVKQFNEVMQNPPESAKVFTVEKSYTKPREEELFSMIQNGCEISDGKLFKSLCLVLSSS